MEEKETGWGCFGVLVWTLIVMVGGAICGGWAIRILWGWFIIPIFGLPVLTIAQAIGVGMMVNLLTSRTQTQKDDRDTTERIVYATFYAIGYPALTVGIAWVVTLFEPGGTPTPHSGGGRMACGHASMPRGRQHGMMGGTWRSVFGTPTGRRNQSG